MASRLVLACPDSQVWRLIGLEGDAEGDSGESPHAAARSRPAGAPVEIEVCLL